MSVAGIWALTSRSLQLPSRTQAAYSLARKLGVECPVIEGIYRVIHGERVGTHVCKGCKSWPCPTGVLHQTPFAAFLAQAASSKARSFVVLFVMTNMCIGQSTCTKVLPSIPGRMKLSLTVSALRTQARANVFTPKLNYVSQQTGVTQVGGWSLPCG